MPLFRVGAFRGLNPNQFNKRSSRGWSGACLVTAKRDLRSGSGVQTGKPTGPTSQRVSRERTRPLDSFLE